MSLRTAVPVTDDLAISPDIFGRLLSGKQKIFANGATGSMKDATGHNYPEV